MTKTSPNGFYQEWAARSKDFLTRFLSNDKNLFEYNEEWPELAAALNPVRRNVSSWFIPANKAISKNKGPTSLQAGKSATEIFLNLVSESVSSNQAAAEAAGIIDFTAHDDGAVESLVEQQKRRNVVDNQIRVISSDTETISLADTKYVESNNVSDLALTIANNWPALDDVKLEVLTWKTNIHFYSENEPFVVYPFIVWGDADLAISEAESDNTIIVDFIDVILTNGWNKYRLLEPISAIQPSRIINKDAVGLVRVHETQINLDLVKYAQKYAQYYAKNVVQNEDEDQSLNLCFILLSPSGSGARSFFMRKTVDRLFITKRN